MRRRALSEVISTVILSGVVLAIGGAIWAYSLGATTAIADGYVDDTLSLVNEIVERFDVEHIHYNITNEILRVWVYNYGEVDITVDVYFTANSTIENSTLKEYPDGINILSGQVTMVTYDYSFLTNPLFSGDAVAVKVYSRRQNVAYKSYVVP
jgi:hypothetical protein